MFYALKKIPSGAVGGCGGPYLGRTGAKLGYTAAVRGRWSQETFLPAGVVIKG